MAGRVQAIAAAVRAQTWAGMEGTCVLCYGRSRWASMTWAGGVWTVESGDIGAGGWLVVGEFAHVAVAFCAAEGEVG